MEIINALEENRKICVYKATGLGITELILLWTLWKACVDTFFQDKEAIIVTGPNVELSKELIDRCKKLLRGRVSYIDQGAYGLSVQRCKIRCYPSNNIASARGKPRVCLFFGDEAAFFQVKDDHEIQNVGERYIGKSNSYVIWVSTAGVDPVGFFYEIKEAAHSVYIRLHMYEPRGLEKHEQTGTSIYSLKFIEKARQSDSHAQEYLGIWGHNIGDVYSQEALDIICSEDYQIDPNDSSQNRLGFCDPGYGSSQFGIVITETRKGIFHVIYAEDYDRKSATQMIEKIGEIAETYNVHQWGCDKANPEVIKDMRDVLMLSTTGISNKEVGREMTKHGAKQVRKQNVKIHPRYLKLKQQLMTIKYGKNGQPKKTDGNPYDLGDAFQGNLWLRKTGGGYVSIITEDDMLDQLEYI